MIAILTSTKLPAGSQTSPCEDNPHSKSDRSISLPPLSKSPSLSRSSRIPRSGRSQSLHSNYLVEEVERLRENLSLLSVAPQVNVTLKFTQPSEQDGFWKRVLRENVVLETAEFHRRKLSVVGCVRVTNLFFKKKVSVHGTWNEWEKKFKVSAQFKCNYDLTDVFNFELPICCSHCSTMMFAIRYKAGGKKFWDSNGGENYSVQIEFPTRIASDTTDSATQTALE